MKIEYYLFKNSENPFRSGGKSDMGCYKAGMASKNRISYNQFSEKRGNICPRPWSVFSCVELITLRTAPYSIRARNTKTKQPTTHASMAVRELAEKKSWMSKFNLERRSCLQQNRRLNWYYHVIRWNRKCLNEYYRLPNKHTG